MKKDQIVEEIHKFREDHARKFRYDLQAMFTDLRLKQAKRKNVANLKPVKPAMPCVAEPHAIYENNGMSKSSKKAR